MKITDALRYAEDGFELKIDTTPPDQPPSPASSPTKPGGYGIKTRTYQEPVPPPVPSLAKVVEWTPSVAPPASGNDNDWLTRPLPPEKPPLRITTKQPEKPAPKPEGPPEFLKALAEHRKQPPSAVPSSGTPYLPQARPENAVPTLPFSVVKTGEVRQPFKLKVRAAVANRLNSIAGELANTHHAEVASELGITPDAAKLLIGNAIRNNLKLALLLHKQPDRKLNNYSYTLRNGNKTATIDGTYS